MGRTTTVAFVSDSRMLRDLLGLAIHRERDLTLAGTAATAAEGGALVADARPDVVLVDLALPDCDGITLAAALSEQHPGGRVVVMADAWDQDLVHRATRAGVCGVVARSSALDGVLDMIRAARRGSVVVDRTILLGLTAAGPDAAGPPRWGTGERPLLTRRELEVLRLLSAGKDLRTISRELSITPNTCRGYLKTTLAKLHAHSQLEAVLTARRLGLVPDPEGDRSHLDAG
jgi:DNA-binding NarL/FixJ family response regulator